MDKEIFERIITATKLHIKSAEKKHPIFPMDIVKAAAVVAVEAGELLDEAIDITDGHGDYTNLICEAFHVITTSMRFLEMIAVYKE